MRDNVRYFNQRWILHHYKGRNSIRGDRLSWVCEAPSIKNMIWFDEVKEQKMLPSEDGSNW